MLPEANIFDVCESVAYNRSYIDDCYEASENHEKLQYRICIVGHGRSGKDTALEILARKLNLRCGGTTSKAVVPLISYSLYGSTDSATQDKCYANRHSDRMYWFDYCNLLRRIDPYLLLKLVLADSDFIGGTRSCEEFLNSLDLFKPHNVLWIARKGIPQDPTLEYDRSYVAEACMERNIRHTTVGNNDDIATFAKTLEAMVDCGIILKGPMNDPDIAARIRDSHVL